MSYSKGPFLIICWKQTHFVLVLFFLFLGKRIFFFLLSFLILERVSFHWFLLQKDFILIGIRSFCLISLLSVFVLKFYRLYSLDRLFQTVQARLGFWSARNRFATENLDLIYSCCIGEFRVAHDLVMGWVRINWVWDCGVCKLITGFGSGEIGGRTPGHGGRL